MANQEEDLIGQQFGNYRLVSLLGQGGFADVYLGEHIHLKTQAAIKILRTRLTSDDREKFLTEARTIAHLEHPNIIRVWDFGVENGLPYLVMARAEHGTLRQLYPKGSRLASAEIIPYVKQVADALHYAHAQRLVHRDVKPENMLLGKNREVLLSDFGIALVTQSSRYQNTQDVVGTVAYMAPEQLQGKPSPASDQYSLGIVVYEWLCGERPFQGSFLEIFGQHISVPPRSLREINPAIPLAVEQAVFVALAKNPQERFGNIKAFANALENALAEAESTTFVRPSPQSSNSSPDAATFVSTPQQTPGPGFIPPSFPSISSLSTEAPTFVKPPQQSTPAPAFTPVPPPGGSSPQQPAFSGSSPSFSSPSVNPLPPNPAAQGNAFRGSTPQAGMFDGPAGAPPPAKVGGRKSTLSTLVKVLSIVLVVLVVGVGALVGISILRQRGGNNGSPNTGTPGTPGQSSTSLTVTPGSSNSTPGSTSTTPGATTSSGPTQSAPSSLTINDVTLPLAIKCVSCNYPGLTLALASITADTAGGTTLWSFTITNGGASECSNISFYNFQLEDQNGTQFQTSGQASDNWALNAGSSTTESPTLAMIPRASDLYTLNITLSGNCTNGGNVYQTENLRFTASALTGDGTDTSLTPLTPQKPSLPLKIACVQCGYSALTLTLTSISANSAGSVTIWHFTIANAGASACGRISFYTLQLEDPNGTQFQTSGQASDNWALNAGTQVEESPTFALLPQTGVTYTLNITLSGDCTSGSNVYQTENIQF